MVKIREQREGSLMQARLKEVLNYDSNTGVFTWLTKTSKYATKIKIGSRAGNLNSIGYRRIRIDNVEYLEHQLVWLYIYGIFPNEQIDHLDGNPSNNKLQNLRECSVSENSKNKKMMSNNTSGVTGVVMHKQNYNGKLYFYWVANWSNESGKELHKFFSVLRHGYEEAKEMAIAFRAEKLYLLELNHNIVYSDRHGK